MSAKKLLAKVTKRGNDVSVARVVVIDDEPLVAEAAAVALRCAGHEVITAHDGASGLRLVSEWRPDVVVSDIRMPDIDGRQLAARLKGQAETAHLPVVLISGHAEATAEECDAFLAKPFQVSDLLAVVRRLVARRAEQGG